MGALLCERVADALPQPAIAARHQCNRALQVHRRSPKSECAVASSSLVDRLSRHPVDLTTVSQAYLPSPDLQDQPCLMADIAYPELDSFGRVVRRLA